MILLLNFADASAASTYGDPPALLTTTSSRPCRCTIAAISAATASSSRTSQERNSYGSPSTARRAHVTTVAPWSAKTALMPAPTPRTPPVTRTTLFLSPRFMSAASVTVLAYQASACLGTDPRKCNANHVHDHRTGHRLGHRRLPAGQRHSVARLVRTRRRHHHGGRRPRDACRDPPRGGSRLQRRRRHQGDAEDRGFHCAHRRQPRLLRGVPRRLRMRGAGGRGCQRLL